MVMASKDGLMALFMMANGRKVKLTGMEFYTMLTVMFMKETGRTIKQMERGLTLTPMEPSTSASGKMTSSMVQVLSRGLTVLCTMVSTRKARNMVEAN